MHSLTRDIRRHAARRAALGIAVVLVHIGVIIMIAFGAPALRRQPTEPPLLVAFLPAPPRAAVPLTLPRPMLAVERPRMIPPPEFQVPTDRTEVVPAAVAGADEHRPDAPGPSSDSGPGPSLRVMSTVAYLHRPSPAYPRESRLAREEGLVILKVLIDETGHARDIDVYRSSGHPRLDREACAAVARALFKPYLDGGTARPAVAMVPIEFSLRGKSS